MWPPLEVFLLIDEMQNPPAHNDEADDGLQWLSGGIVLSYKEAVAHTKAEHCRKWCSGTLCPTYVRNVPEGFKEVVWRDFQEFRASIANQNHPGTAITLDELLASVNSWKGYYHPNNPELVKFYGLVASCIAKLLTEGKK